MMNKKGGEEGVPLGEAGGFVPDRSAAVVRELCGKCARDFREEPQCSGGGVDITVQNVFCRNGAHRAAAKAESQET